MATRYAVANGNWSNTATWDGGTLPTSADDVHANNRTVTIDQDVTVLSIRTTAGGAAVAGGTFNTVSSGTININANIIAGSTGVITVNGTCTLNLTGNVTAGTHTNGSAVVLARYGGYTSTNDLPVATINGNIIGGSVTGAEGVRVWGGTITINGSITGGTASTGASGFTFYNSENQPVKITINNGPITGGSSSGGSTAGVSLQTSLTGTSLANSFLNINCNLVGGTNQTSNPALSSSSSIPITIIGNLTPTSSNGATIGNILVNVSITGNINGTGVSGIGLSIAAFNSLILNGNLTAGTGTAALNFTNWPAGTSSATITGTIIGGTGSESTGIRIDGSGASAGTLTINGNCTAGTGGYALRNLSASGVNITVNGNVSGAATGSVAAVMHQASPSTVTINGTVTGGGVSGIGAQNNSTGRIVINGNVTGGGGLAAYGAYNNSTGTIIINGIATAGVGSIAHGAFNNSTGVLIVKRAKGNGYGVGSAGIQISYGVASSVQGSQTYVEEIEMGSRGAFPIINHILFINKSTNSALFYTSGLLSTKTLVDASVSGLMPSGYDVRNGVIYNAGNLVGTMNVPSTNNVAYNVPVDSGVGTAILRPQDVWDYMRINITGSGSIGERLKNSATVSSVGDQIAAF